MELAEPTRLALLALVGLVAGTVNTVAGGGSLLTIPALIFFGLPAPVANATNRVGVLLQSLIATWQFRRRGLLPLGRVGGPTVAACAGAGIGAAFGARIDAAALEQTIGIMMLVVVGILLLRPKRWLSPRPAAGQVAQAAAFFAVGLYGGFLQAGVGFFLLLALVGLAGWDLVAGNGVKSLLVAAFTVPALVVFVAHDLVAWGPGLCLAAGSAAGGWLGTKLAVGWGPKFVLGVLVVTVAAAATKLLGLW